MPSLPRTYSQAHTLSHRTNIHLRVPTLRWVHSHSHSGILMAFIVIFRKKRRKKKHGWVYTVTFDIQQAAERIALCRPPPPLHPSPFSTIPVLLRSVFIFIFQFFFFFFGNQAGVACSLTFVPSLPSFFSHSPISHSPVSLYISHFLFPVAFSRLPFCARVCVQYNDICCPLFECLSLTRMCGTHARKSRIDKFLVLCYPADTMTP